MSPLTTNDVLDRIENSIANLVPETNVKETSEAINQIMNEIIGLQPVQQDHFLNSIAKKLPKLSMRSLREQLAQIKQSVNGASYERSSLNKLMDLFEKSGSSVFLDQFGNGWITARVENHYENINIGSSKFEGMMLSAYYEEFGKGVDFQIIRQMGILLTEWADESRELYNRFAWLDGKLLIDMCDKEWHSIQVSETGWEIVQLQKPPFKRYSHQRPLPWPEENGDIRRIFNYLSIKKDGDRAMLLTWLCTAMFEHVDRPGIILHGLHGSCKSTGAYFLRSVIDPSFVGHSSLSKNHTEFIQLIDHNALISLDNLSSMPGWASDDLCTAVSGGGFSKRSLFTNDEDFSYSFRRVFILNGISVPTIAPDLLERSITIELQRLDRKERKKKTQLEVSFKKDLPIILGDILNVMVNVIARRHEESQEHSRLADWFSLAKLAAEHLGILEDFIEAYDNSESQQHAEVIDSHVESQVLIQFLEKNSDWTGTSAEFYGLMTELAHQMKVQKAWPKNSNSLTRKLKRLSHDLKEIGIEFENGTTGKARTISIRRIEENRNRDSDDIVPFSSEVSEFGVTHVVDVKQHDNSYMECLLSESSDVRVPVKCDKVVCRNKNEIFPIPDEVRAWNDKVQESFFRYLNWNLDEGFDADEAIRYAMESTKRTEDYRRFEVG